MVATARGGLRLGQSWARTNSPLGCSARAELAAGLPAAVATSPLPKTSKGASFGRQVERGRGPGRNGRGPAWGGVEGRLVYAFSASTTALPLTRPLPALGERSLPLSATVEPQQYTLGMGLPSLSVSWLSVVIFMPPCVL